MGKLRILLADDHAIVRAGLRMLLESQPDMEVVGEAEDGLQAIQNVRKLRPDVVVMDIVMQGLSGLEATERIKTEFPEVQILALTMYEDERYFFRLIQAGASGYVVKGAPPSDLIAALRSISQGEAYLYPSLARKLVDDYLSRTKAEEGREDYDDLTSREREVLRLIAEGRTGKEISELLCISVHTVERHRQNLMAKLGLHNRAALIKYAIRKGLIEIDS
jgi:two-component system response regulator NreC